MNKVDMSLDDIIKLNRKKNSGKKRGSANKLTRFLTSRRSKRGGRVSSGVSPLNRVSTKASTRGGNKTFRSQRGRQSVRSGQGQFLRGSRQQRGRGQTFRSSRGRGFARGTQNQHTRGIQQRGRGNSGFRLQRKNNQGQPQGQSRKNYQGQTQSQGQRLQQYRAARGRGRGWGQTRQQNFPQTSQKQNRFNTFNQRRGLDQQQSNSVTFTRGRRLNRNFGQLNQGNRGQQRRWGQSRTSSFSQQIKTLTVNVTNDKASSNPQDEVVLVLPKKNRKSQWQQKQRLKQQQQQQQMKVVQPHFQLQTMSPPPVKPKFEFQKVEFGAPNKKLTLNERFSGAFSHDEEDDTESQQVWL